ncbi:bifunctional riboflavin kinase/FAD synthetase [Jeotgalibacillus aurantiacus]|uniref:bifunctional riboflavin kinase/FAD synthetase n=1 Tax=Jeotgalibacillus aurantiacus TaxID=2763266 RepID=UPI001D09F7B2|nr:bifunctional riboflavin kinase/FAD synthetase [Jeotgalibacillus aurantiacus]
MKVYTLHHPHELVKEELPKLSIALGFFDGVHKGHQKVIQTAVDYAAQHRLKSAVMTFEPHPSIVLSSKKDPVRLLSTLSQKLEKIRHLGVDYVFVVRFTSAFAGLEPQQFVDQYLINLNVVHVTAGFDFSYGKMGRGKMDTLPFHSRNAFTSTIVEKQELSDEKISSTRIRQLIGDGEVQAAAELLGEEYITEGSVIHGEKRGRKIGFPTANISYDPVGMIPSPGVYAVQLHVLGRWHDGVCNIGYKPTFNDPGSSALSVEVHLFDFSESIYGEEVKVKWVKRIRSEKKFDGIDSLVRQISLDKDSAIELFRERNKKS